MKKFKWLAVINPASKGGRTSKNWNGQIKPVLDLLGINYDEILTEYPGYAIDVVKKEASNYDGCLAVGGDGTTNEVLNGILHSASKETVMGIVPAGTGNDIANTFGVPLELKSACLMIKGGKTKRVDVGLTKGRNFEGKITFRYFGGIASFGFDADVAFQTRFATKRLPGTVNYIVSMLKNLITFKERLFKISLIKNGSIEKSIQKSALLVAVGNGESYGAGMKVCPGANIHDGRFHITMIKGIPKLEFIKTFPSVFEGTHITHPAVEIFESPKLIIQTGMYSRYQVDGEVVGPTPTIVTTIPDGLKILTT